MGRRRIEDNRKVRPGKKDKRDDNETWITEGW